MTDPLLQRLDNLPPATLDVSRADRIRRRCHAALARRRPSRVSHPARVARVWTSIVMGLGAVYMTTLVRQVLTLYGLL